jgi:hypothetical protein
MSDCIDKNIGRMLHDFELNLLSEDDKRRFEMHLYDCEYCLEQVREFMDVSKILARDPDAIALIEKVAAESGEKDKKPFTPFLKILVAAILVVVIILPIYRYALHKTPPEVVQTLELRPTREGGSDVIYLEKGGDIAINFYVADDFKGPANIVISKVSGDTVLSLQNFTDFDDRGLGSIKLPVTEFTEGHYSLHIIPSSGSGLQKERLYMFRVKED